MFYSLLDFQRYLDSNGNVSTIKREKQTYLIEDIEKRNCFSGIDFLGEHLRQQLYISHLTILLTI